MHGSASTRMVLLAWRNVVRNWRHSLATILAIASGFTAVSLFDGFLKELEARNADGYQRRGMMADVVVQRKDAQHYLDEDFWAYAMTKAEQDFVDAFLAKDPSFKQRVRFLSVSGLASNGRNNAVFMGNGYDVPEGDAVRGERWKWNAIAGVPLSQGKQPAVLLGVGLGRLLDCESTYQGPKYVLPDGNYKPEERPYHCLSPRVTLSATTEAAQVNAIDLNVVGLIDAGFREADKRAVSLSLQDAQRLLDTDKITLMSIELKDERDAPAFMDRLRKAADDKGLKLDVMKWSEHKAAEYVRGGFQILSTFRNLFMVIVVTISVMSVANTMMKSVNERIREIGTLRSIGFLRRHLVMMFAWEGCFLSLVACAFGLVLTLVLTWLVERLGISYRAGFLSEAIDLRVKYAPVAWVVSSILLSLLATGTAWFCSKRASKMVVADALRHV